MMAMTKVKDIVVKVREYQDQHGNKKAQWANVGTLMRGGDGNEFILLDRHFNPAGIANPENRGNVLLSMFDPKPREERGGNGDAGGYQKPPADQSAPYDDMSDSIPF